MWINNTDFRYLIIRWCFNYRRRKWTRGSEFKSSMTLHAFHFVFMPMRKTWICLLSSYQWADWVLLILVRTTGLGEGKLWIQTNCTSISLNIDQMSHPTCGGGLIHMWYQVFQSNTNNLYTIIWYVIQWPHCPYLILHRPCTFVYLSYWYFGRETKHRNKSPLSAN